MGDFFKLITRDWTQHYFHLSRNIFEGAINVASYLTLAASFLYFVFSNNGIVVGDREAHNSKIHLPQLMYFSLFYVFFTWPYVIIDVEPFVKCVLRRKKSFAMAISFCVFAIYFTTIVHPYLLADNRHYTFYIWNRFYGKYDHFRYLMIPLYCLGWYSMLSKFQSSHTAPFYLAFLFVSFLGLAVHGMVEIRYFLMPYIIIRVKLGDKVKLWQLLVEFVYFCLINAFTFTIFFTKEIYWTDFTDVQRLIW